MKRRRPLSYQIGDLVMRQDAHTTTQLAGRRVQLWRVFAVGVELKSGSRDECLAYVREIAPAALRSAFNVSTLGSDQ